MSACLSVGALGLVTGCGNQKSAADATSSKINNKNIAAANDKEVAKSLKAIREKFEGKSHLLVLEKEYWVNKRIWVTIGIERASVTGLAGSVMGYIPTYLRKVNQLLVLERDNTGRFASSALSPDIALNAYPIVDENEAAIVVDVSSPRSEYGLTNMGFYAGPTANTELKPRLEFVKDVSISETGVAFKSVINAVSPVAFYEKGSGSPEEAAGLDPFSVSLTVRTDWRIPNPTEGYVALDAAAQPAGFFLGAPRVTNGGLSVKRFVNRLSLDRKQVWEISPNTPALYQDAVREGVLAWNAALGKDVLEVRVGTAGKDNTDPTTSNVVWDDNKAVGFAFANWRENPETGEIMQGQVYMSGDMWAEQGGLVYDLRKLEKLMRESMNAAREAERAQQNAPVLGPNLPGTENRELVEKVRKLQREIATSVAKIKRNLSSPYIAKRGFLSLNAAHTDEVSHKGFCQREVNVAELRDIVSAVILTSEGMSVTDKPFIAAQATQEEAVDKIERTLEHMPYPADGITRAQFQASVVRSVVMHEVGHAIGLRHNFMGSLETSQGGKVESASIMDYNDLVVDAQFVDVGDSDRAMINMGYHRQAPAAPFKFCTDENVEAGTPGCHRHDYSKDPVDFFVTAQESNLLMGLYFAQRGDMTRFVRNVNNSLRWGLELVGYLNVPTMEGMQVNPAFADQQKRALAALIESRKMYDLPFPEEIAAIYGNLSRMVTATTLKGGAAETMIKDDLISDLRSSVLDSESLMDKDTRISGLVGLVKLQDASARHSLKGLISDLKTQSTKQDSERNLESRMMDEFIQNAAQQALDSYFAVGAEENQ
ncbi:MAG TPA: zinc-dependent metalloprotease [Bdellovibrionota bacterium]|nr:zinc-dependent metalloprotease [Bdellovibrionota bacterium]